LPDHPQALNVEGVLANVAAIVEATQLPVNADFQSGYASSVEELAANVADCVDTGVAGLSIEDSTGDDARPLYEIAEAVDRIKAARASIDAYKDDVLLCGRAECFLTGHPDPLREAITRLQAYAEAGADVLFAPGIRTLGDIRTLVKALSPKPVNVLVGWKAEYEVAELAEAGVRRISVGSGLARAAWGGFIRAAKILAEGSFEGFSANATFTDLNSLLATESPR